MIKKKILNLTSRHDTIVYTCEQHQLEKRWKFHFPHRSSVSCLCNLKLNHESFFNFNSTRWVNNPLWSCDNAHIFSITLVYTAVKILMNAKNTFWRSILPVWYYSDPTRSDQMFAWDCFHFLVHDDDEKQRANNFATWEFFLFFFSFHHIWCCWLLLCS